MRPSDDRDDRGGPGGSHNPGVRGVGAVQPVQIHGAASISQTPMDPLTIVPSAQGRIRHRKRPAAQAMPGHASIAQLLREMVQRTGYTHQELADRMGTSRPAISGALHIYTSCDHPRHPSFQWVVRFAGACGCRVLIEFSDEDPE